MKFEDLTNIQLKKVIRNYRLHLLFDITGFSRFDREKLLNICKKLLIIDNEKIKPKITEPIYFDIPVKPAPRRRQREKPEQKEQPEQKKRIFEEMNEKINKKNKKLESENKRIEEEYNKLIENKKKSLKQEKQKKTEKIENKIFIRRSRNNDDDYVVLEDAKLSTKDFTMIKENKKIIVVNPKDKIFHVKNLKQIVRSFEFPYREQYFKINDKMREFILLSFTIIDNKIIFNGWSLIEKRSGFMGQMEYYYIDFLVGYLGGGSNIINYMKNKVLKENNYFYLSSLSTRGTVDFYRKMGLLQIKKSLKAHFLQLKPRVIEKQIKNIQNATDYDRLYYKMEDVIYRERGDRFFYFPNEEVKKTEYPSIDFEEIPSGRDWMIAYVEVILKKNKNQATKFVDNLIKKTIDTKGQLEGTGKFLD